MRKSFVIAVCAACLSVAGLAAQDQGGDNNSKASFTQFVQASIKATTSNDAKWLEANLADGYVEGTSYGAWIPKAQLIKDAGDPANNKFMKSDISDVQTEVIGNIGLARFKETYDAMIEGTHRARTIICSTIAQNQSGTWKALSNHCSKVE
ncbi:MAG TPA: nuclear transport factor 2 family protein [Terriglobales bacterium]|nr:nuclear transport factor 2 family protein [Terriglobales bacterium]